MKPKEEVIKKKKKEEEEEVITLSRMSKIVQGYIDMSMKNNNAFCSINFIFWLLR